MSLRTCPHDGEPLLDLSTHHSLSLGIRVWVCPACRREEETACADDEAPDTCYQPLPLDLVPSAHPPGSPGRIADYERRAGRGLSVFCPADDNSALGRVASNEVGLNGVLTRGIEACPARSRGGRRGRKQTGHCRRYRARVWHEGRWRHVGYYPTLSEAQAAVRQARRELGLA